MTKNQLIEQIAAKAELNKTQASAALEAFISSVGEALKEGDKISLVGFGTFSVSERKARVGRNPKTGESLQIPAKNVVKFKAGKVLEEVVSL